MILYVLYFPNRLLCISDVPFKCHEGKVGWDWGDSMKRKYLSEDKFSDEIKLLVRVHGIPAEVPVRIEL